MFCTQCGTQLKDGSRFCTSCGAPQPAAQPQPMPAAEPEWPLQAPITPPLPETDEIPATHTPQQSQQFTQEPAWQPPVVDVYSDAHLLNDQPGKKKKKKEKKPGSGKKSKLGIILAICIPLVLILLVGGFIVYRIHDMGQTYAAAQEALDAGDYDLALSLFEELGNYEDSASQVKLLKRSQRDYDEAMELLADGEYDEAAEAFQDLGDYRDSAEQAACNVPYQKALAIMACAEAGDEAGLDLLPEAPAATEEDALSIVLYRGAADLFTALGQYADAPQKADDCWYAIGMICLEQQNWEGADEVMTLMSDTMRETFRAEYMKLCSDIPAQGALINALKEFLDLSTAEPEYKQTVTAQIEKLSGYLDDHFYRDGIRELLARYLEGLEAEAEVLKDEGGISNSTAWYKARALQSEALDALNADFGFLANNDDLREKVIGNTTYYQNCVAISEDLYNQINGQTLKEDNALGEYLTYTNNTGSDFELTFYFVFRDGSKQVGQSESAKMTIKAGETVKIPLNVPGDCPDWNRWTFYRSFSILN